MAANLSTVAIRKHGRPPAIERLIHSDNRQRAVPVELAIPADAADLQIRRIVPIEPSTRRQAERFLLKLGATPRAFLQRNGRGPALIVPERDGAPPRGHGMVVILAAHLVGRR